MVSSLFLSAFARSTISTTIEQATFVIDSTTNLGLRGSASAFTAACKSAVRVAIGMLSGTVFTPGTPLNKPLGVSRHSWLATAPISFAQSGALASWFPGSSNSRRDGTLVFFRSPGISHESRFFLLDGCEDSFASVVRAPDVEGSPLGCAAGAADVAEGGTVVDDGSGTIGGGGDTVPLGFSIGTAGGGGNVAGAGGGVAGSDAACSAGGAVASGLLGGGGGTAAI
mmetsp:Transcript_23938/g.66527  ORF Transcript_23938/g.66527 Transcript_23938/m.66527 type:complete len:226 (-) Transcript_23938:186-863(-)